MSKRQPWSGERVASPFGTALEMPELPANEMDWTHTSHKPAPKRPWKCPECSARMAFGHTFRKHLLIHQETKVPVAKQPGQRAGALACTACPARYDSEQEMEMHHQARHRWLWEQ